MRLAAVDYGGHGPGIVLLHGLLDDAGTWASTAGWLIRHGRVVALDAPVRTGDVACTVRQLGLAAAVLIGHSTGAVTAWQLAGAQPDLVRAIVLAEPATAELDAVSCPALVVRGAASGSDPSALAALAGRLAPGRYAEVPDAGHPLHHDNPAGWRAAVEPFVAETLAGYAGTDPPGRNSDVRSA